MLCHHLVRSHLDCFVLSRCVKWDSLSCDRPICYKYLVVTNPALATFPWFPCFVIFCHGLQGVSLAVLPVTIRVADARWIFVVSERSRLSRTQRYVHTFLIRGVEVQPGLLLFISCMDAWSIAVLVCQSWRHTRFRARHLQGAQISNALSLCALSAWWFWWRTLVCFSVYIEVGLYVCSHAILYETIFVPIAQPMARPRLCTGYGRLRFGGWWFPSQKRRRGWWLQADNLRSARRCWHQGAEGTA